MKMNRKQAMEYTPMYSKIPCNYYLKKSVILSKHPRGLWTKNKISKGSYIGEYKGEIITYAESQERNSNYKFEVKYKHTIIYIIDGQSKKVGSFIKFVNAANTLNQQNTQFEQHNKKILLKAIKDIDKNQELIAYYGNNTKNIISST